MNVTIQSYGQSVEISFSEEPTGAQVGALKEISCLSIDRVDLASHQIVMLAKHEGFVNQAEGWIRSALELPGAEEKEYKDQPRYELVPNSVSESLGEIQSYFPVSDAAVQALQEIGWATIKRLNEYWLSYTLNHESVSSEVVLAWFSQILDQEKANLFEGSTEGSTEAYHSGYAPQKRLKVVLNEYSSSLFEIFLWSPVAPSVADELQRQIPWLTKCRWVNGCRLACETAHDSIDRETTVVYLKCLLQQVWEGQEMKVLARPQAKFWIRKNRYAPKMFEVFSCFPLDDTAAAVLQIPGVEGRVVNNFRICGQFTDELLAVAGYAAIEKLLGDKLVATFGEGAINEAPEEEETEEDTNAQTTDFPDILGSILGGVMEVVPGFLSAAAEVASASIDPAEHLVFTEPYEDDSPTLEVPAEQVPE